MVITLEFIVNLTTQVLASYYSIELSWTMDKTEQKRIKATGKDDQSRPTKLKVIMYVYTELVQNIFWNFYLRIAIAISSCAPL